jgi:hypothetical protein
MSKPNRSGDLSACWGVRDVQRGVTWGRWSGFPQPPVALPTLLSPNPAGTGLIDLNSLVNLPNGVTLTRAEDINNVGQVIAIGIPEPESYAMFLAGLGLIGFMVWRERLIAEKRLKSTVIFRSF